MSTASRKPSWRTTACSVRPGSEELALALDRHVEARVLGQRVLERVERLGRLERATDGLERVAAAVGGWSTRASVQISDSHTRRRPRRSDDGPLVLAPLDFDADVEPRNCSGALADEDSFFPHSNCGPP
jgi:hypothetical protein